MVSERGHKNGVSNWLLEATWFIYSFVVMAVFFLFFTLILDVFCLLAFGGWNPLLGSWPIFTGTVNSVFYSPPAHVACLLIGLGVIARIMHGNRIPYVLSLAFRQESQDVSQDDN